MKSALDDNLEFNRSYIMSFDQSRTHIEELVFLLSSGPNLLNVYLLSSSSFFEYSVHEP